MNKFAPGKRGDFIKLDAGGRIASGVTIRPARLEAGAVPTRPELNIGRLPASTDDSKGQGVHG